MEYTVQPGDTLTKIARANPGTTPVSIANANGIPNMDDIKAGQVLQLPDVAPEAVIPGEESGAVPDRTNELVEKVFDSKKTGQREVNKYVGGDLLTGDYPYPPAGVTKIGNQTYSLEGKGVVDPYKPKPLSEQMGFKKAINPKTGEEVDRYTFDAKNLESDVEISEAAQYAGKEIKPTKPSVTGDEEPVLDGPPVVEVIEEEPGEDLTITELTKESANQTKKIIYDSLPEDSKPVYQDVLDEIDALGFDPQPKNWYEDIAKNINEKIAEYNTKISDVAEEKMKPTFEGWDKFLAVLGSALGAYGSAMTGVPNFALQIVNNAIDRDTQAFLKSKEIRTKSLENQRMDLIMMRGEKLQMAQNRITQLMQSETFKLSKTKAKADIKATYDKLAQELALNKQNVQLVLAGYMKDLYTSDVNFRASLSKEQRKKMVNSITVTNSKGDLDVITAYVARDTDTAKKITNDQKNALKVLAILDEINELHKSPTVFVPAWMGGSDKSRLNTLTAQLELLLKEQMNMGAHYSEYEQARIKAIAPGTDLTDMLYQHKIKSDALRDEVIAKLKRDKSVESFGEIGDSSAADQILRASQENIQKFGGTKISN